MVGNRLARMRIRFKTRAGARAARSCDRALIRPEPNDRLPRQYTIDPLGADEPDAHWPAALWDLACRSRGGRPSGFDFRLRARSLRPICRGSPRRRRSLSGRSRRGTRRRRGDSGRHVRLDARAGARRHAAQARRRAARRSRRCSTRPTRSSPGARIFRSRSASTASRAASPGRCPIQLYNRDVVRAALKRLPGPGGGTAIGEAMRDARPDLYRAGVFRKYLLVVTDGENTNGRDPDDVAREIFRKSEGAVQIYFVAFDTSPEKFAFLKEVGGDVIGAGSGPELRHGARRHLPGQDSRRGDRRGRAGTGQEVTSSRHVARSRRRVP